MTIFIDAMERILFAFDVDTKITQGILTFAF